MDLQGCASFSAGKDGRTSGWDLRDSFLSYKKRSKHEDKLLIIMRNSNRWPTMFETSNNGLEETTTKVTTTNQTACQGTHTKNSLRMNF